MIDTGDLVPAAEIVKFLLNCDPNVALQKYEGMSLLHYACWSDYNDSNIDTGIEAIKAIYDVHQKQSKTTVLRPIFIVFTNKCKHLSTGN